MMAVGLSVAVGIGKKPWHALAFVVVFLSRMATPLRCHLHLPKPTCYELLQKKATRYIRIRKID